MDDFDRKVAVVTGAASGIGEAMARTFAAEGMHLVLADRDAPALAALTTELGGTGSAVLGVPVDCGRRAEVQRLRDATYDRFGTVHVVCNNAGVGGGGHFTSGDLDVAGWREVMDIDMFGVLYGVEAFLPRLLDQAEGHIVNTASRQGLVGAGATGAYCAAKSATVAMTEKLHDELSKIDTPVGISLLCPGPVRTGMLPSPADLADGTDVAYLEMLAQRHVEAAEPEEVAALVLRAIRLKRFYVLTHAETLDWIDERTARIAADLAVLGSPR